MRWLITALVALILAMPVPALAEDDPPEASPEQRAEAQQLFDKARALMDEGKIEEACTTFEASQKLDPAALGTKLNLGNCYEKLERLASAWIMYTEVATLARRAGQDKRADFAQSQADKIEPRISRLKVTVDEPVDGLVITRNGREIAEASWGTAIPVDNGKLTVRAKAPGKLTWSKSIEIEGEGEELELTVPALEDAPKEAEPAPDPEPVVEADEGEPDDNTVTLALGITGTVLGALGVAGGGVLRAIALDKSDESLTHCEPDDSSVCTQEGADLRDEAQALQAGSVAAWAAGGAFLVAGVVIIVLATSDDDSSDEASRRLRWGVGVSPYGAFVSTTIAW